MSATNEDKPVNVRDMVANYVSLARRGGRYWKRAFVVLVLIVSGGMAWVMTRVRTFKSEASAAVHDVSIMSNERRNPEEAQADLRARLDLVYGSRANMGRVVDELHLYPWLRGATSHSALLADQDRRSPWLLRLDVRRGRVTSSRPYRWPHHWG